MPPKLGEILICAKIIDQHQLESALSAQQKWGGKLGEILVNSGLCSEEMMVRALSRQLDVARAELDHIASVPAQVLHKIPLELSQALDVLPLELRDGDTLLVVAMSDPLNAAAIDELTRRTHCRIHALLAGPHAIAASRARLYRTEGGEQNFGGACAPLAGVREKVVVRGVSEFSKLIDRDALDLSGRPPPRARNSAVGLAGDGAAPAPRAQATAAAAPEEALRALQAAAEESSALLRALIDTMIDQGLFSREAFLKNLRDS